MALRNYEIRIKTDSVDARWDNSSRPIWLRLLGSAAVALGGALLAYVGLIRPDRNGYSNLWRLMHDHFTSRFLIDAVIPGCYIFLVWLLFAALAIRSFFTSGQMLHCDRSQLTVAKIPWINFNGQWRSRTFPVAEISQMELAIWPTRNRETLYLIRFRACGMEEKILQGINASEGYRILKGVKALGVDVLHGSDARWLAREEIRDRRAEL
jgi:hypothetical protein